MIHFKSRAIPKAELMSHLTSSAFGAKAKAVTFRINLHPGAPGAQTMNCNFAIICWHISNPYYPGLVKWSSPDDPASFLAAALNLISKRRPHYSKYWKLILIFKPQEEEVTAIHIIFDGKPLSWVTLTHLLKASCSVSSAPSQWRICNKLHCFQDSMYASEVTPCWNRNLIAPKVPFAPLWILIEEPHSMSGFEY